MAESPAASPLRRLAGAFFSHPEAEGARKLSGFLTADAPGHILSVSKGCGLHTCDVASRLRRRKSESEFPHLSREVIGGAKKARGATRGQARRLGDVPSPQAAHDPGILARPVGSRLVRDGVVCRGLQWLTAASMASLSVFSSLTYCRIEGCVQHYVRTFEPALHIPRPSRTARVAPARQRQRKPSAESESGTEEDEEETEGSETEVSECDTDEGVGGRVRKMTSSMIRLQRGKLRMAGLAAGLAAGRVSAAV
eukprot:scaffold17139_cov123-Isochrysis_galbana.AAC.1